jgi:hypothetical protein
MAYTYNFVFDFGNSQTGKTVHVEQYDHLGALLATITAGAVELGRGKYSYLHTGLPNGGSGALLAYDSADDSINAVYEYGPTVTEGVAAIMAYAIATGKTVEQALNDIWAVTVGDSTADDPDEPTNITYDEPGGAVQVTHELTNTTRVLT